MKKHTIYFALLITLISSITALADVKIKSKQTVSGQSFENTTYIKGKRQRTEQNMGGMQTVNLTQCDLRRGVQMNPLTKTYLLSLYEQSEATGSNSNKETKADGVIRVGGGTVTSTVTSKDTGETRKMFGYTARHIITTIETASSPDACAVNNSKMQIDGWYIDAAFALDCETDRYKNGYVPSTKQGCQDKYQTKTIGNAKRGYPVYEKMTMFDESGKESFSTVTEVIELSQATLDASLFEIPADYREASDASEMYAVSNTGSINSMGSTSNDSSSGYSNGTSTNSSVIANVQNQANNNGNGQSNPGAKPAGVVRIGINVKTGEVGEGLNATDLAAVFQNTLGEYLKGTKVELVPLEAKLASAIETEAKEKECDYILFATVSHKKGKGGFGMFGKVAPVLGNVVPMAGMGSTAGQIAGQVASTAIYTAANAASNIKPKDEITFDVNLRSGANVVLTKQFKSKAKSAGEDIISPIIEQAATAIVEKVG